MRKGKRKMPLGWPEGKMLVHNGERLTYRGYLGCWALDIVDENGDAFLVSVAGSDRKVRPTIDWCLDEHRAGALLDATNPREALGGPRGDFLTLDRAACVARDRKAAWRHDWATAAIKAGISRGEAGAKAFIALDPAPAVGPKPGYRALLRWIATLMEDPFQRPGNLVSTAGREKGQSQLPQAIDLIVHEEAATYWSKDGDPSKYDVAGRVALRWRELKDQGVQGLGDDPPSAECVRERINALQNRTTFAARHGEYEAQRYYGAKGEPVEVAHVFERVTVDGVRFRHACAFSDDWQIESPQMKGIFAMDLRSQFVCPGAVFSGPFRPEMSMIAIMNVMAPTRATEADLESDPSLATCFSVPSNLHPDNEKVLLPPSSVPGMANLVSWIELPQVYHSDSKSKHERFHRFLKKGLERLPGLVRGPRLASDPRYDPLANAEVTRAQYVKRVELLRRRWNHTPKKSLGWKSPYQVLMEGLGVRKRRDIPRGLIEREMSRTVKVILTTNGVEYDGVRYRFNREGVEKALDGNVRNTPFAKRLQDTGKCELTARVWDGDIDYIEIYDEDAKDYHGLWSTDPGYTSFLSRWEHHQYQEMLAKGKGGGTSRTNRLVERGRRLREQDRELPKLPFRARETGIALLEREEVRRSSGKLGRSAAYDELLERGIVTDVGGADREDKPTPPPQPDTSKTGRKGAAAKRRAPPRDDNYGYAMGQRRAPGQEADEASENTDAQDTPPPSRWAADRTDDYDDEEEDQ